MANLVINTSRTSSVYTTTQTGSSFIISIWFTNGSGGPRVNVTGVTNSDFQLVGDNAGLTWNVSGSGSSRSITVFVPSGAHGRVRLRVLRNSITSSAVTGGRGPVRNTTSPFVTYDRRPFLSARVSSSGGGTTKTEPFNVIVDFTPAVASSGVVAASDFSVSSGMVNWVQRITNSRVRVRVTPPSGSQGTMTFSLIRNSITSSLIRSGRGPTTTTQLSTFSYRTLTTVTIDDPEQPVGREIVGTITNTNTIYIDITWSKDTGTAFNSSDITIEETGRRPYRPLSGSLNNIGTGGTTTHYRLSYNVPSGAGGTTTITIPANTFGNNAVESISFNYDTRPFLSASEGLSSGGATKTGPFTVNINFTPSVVLTNNTVFTSDFSVSSGRINVARRVTNSREQLTITPPTNSSGTITLTLRANSITSHLVRGGRGPTSNRTLATFSYDTRVADNRPFLSVSYSSSTGGATKTDNFTVDVSFSPAVVTSNTIVTTNDFSVSHGSITSSTRQSNSIERLSISLPSNSRGTLSLSIIANSINSNLIRNGRGPTSSSTIASFPFNTIASVTIDAPERPIGTTLSQPITSTSTLYIDITWSRNTGTSFNHSDISIQETGSGTYNPLSAALSNEGTSGTSTHYRLAYSVPTDKSGTTTITIPANTFGGNTSVSRSFTYDTRPFMTISAGLSSGGATKTGPFTVAIDFTPAIVTSNNVVLTSDFSVSSGRINASARVNNSREQLTITPPTNASGTLTLSIKANSINSSLIRGGRGPTRAITLASYNYDTVPPDMRPFLIVSVGTSTGGTVKKGQFTVDISFTPAIVTSGTIVNTSDFSLNVGTINQAIRVDNNTERLSITPPANGSGTLTLSILANSISSPLIRAGQGPTQEVTLNSYSYDTRTNAIVTIDAPERPVGTAVSLPITSVSNVFIDITWSRDTGTSFNHSDISIQETGSGAYNPLSTALSNEGTTQTSTHYRLTYSAPAAASGTTTITIPANTFGENTIVSRSFNYDTRPTLTVTASSSTGPTIKTGPFTVDINFSVDIVTSNSVVAASDFSVSSGSITSIARVDDDTIRLSISPPVDARGSFTLSVLRDSITSTLIRTGTGPKSTSSSITLVTYQYNTVDERPLLTATEDSSTGGTTKAGPFTVDINFSPSLVTSDNVVLTSDFTVSNATINSSTRVDNDTERLTIIPSGTGRGTIALSLNANSIISALVKGGQGPVTSIAIGSYNYDITATIVTIDAPERPVGTAAVVPITSTDDVFIDITWNEDVGTTFDHSDISITETGSGSYNPLSAALSNVGTEGTNTHYRLTYSVPSGASGSTTISIGANTFGNNIATSRSFTYDTRPLLSVTVGTITGPVIKTDDFTIDLNFTPSIVTSDSIIATSDFTLSAGSITSSTRVDNDTERITVSPPGTAMGTLSISLDMNSINSSLIRGGQGPAAAVGLGTFQYDTREIIIDHRPLLHVSVDSQTGGTVKGASFFVTLLIIPSAIINDNILTTDDFILSAGTIAVSERISNRFERLQITSPTSSSGSMTLTLKANVISDNRIRGNQGPHENQLIATFSYNTIAPAPVWTGFVAIVIHPGETITENLSRLVDNETNITLPNPNLLPTWITLGAGPDFILTVRHPGLITQQMSYTPIITASNTTGSVDTEALIGVESFPRRGTTTLWLLIPSQVLVSDGPARTVSLTRYLVGAISTTVTLISAPMWVTLRGTSPSTYSLHIDPPLVSVLTVYSVTLNATDGNNSQDNFIEITILEGERDQQDINIEFDMPDGLLTQGEINIRALLSRPLIAGTETLIPSDFRLDGISGAIITNVAVDSMDNTVYNITVSIPQNTEGTLLIDYKSV